MARRRNAHQAGRISLSDAMFTKLLVTSLWQNRFWVSNGRDLTAVYPDCKLNCVWRELRSFIEEKLLELGVGWVELAELSEVQPAVVQK
jgi:hypothetical protein